MSYGRNWLYDRHIFKSSEFEVPTIVVGNLSMGGTGKSPHIEYLIRLLKDRVGVGVLSRGYGRKSVGYFAVQSDSTARAVGDEPLLFKLKHPDIAVAVAENRVLAIPRLLYDFLGVQTVLLDDAYQHRAVRGGLNILLTTYTHPFYADDFFPVGWLRESKNNYNRADIIIVTKCPPSITQQDKDRIKQQIRPLPYQHVYFSGIEYGRIYSLFAPDSTVLYPDFQLQNKTILLLTAIADNQPLIDFLKQQHATVYPFAFRDHHLFDEYDLEKIRDAFKNIAAPDKILLTTEKDAVRLLPHRDWFLQNGVTVFVQPVAVHFSQSDKVDFDRDILYFLSKMLPDFPSESVADSEAMTIDG